MDTLSLRQSAIMQFLALGRGFTESAKEWPDDSLAHLSDMLLSALTLFGECEFYAREAERCNLLKRQKEREKYASAMMKKRNDAGLEILKLSKARLSQIDFKGIQASRAQITKAAAGLDQYADEFRDILVDSGIKPSDAKKVDSVLTEIMKAAKRGFGDLGELIATKHDELEALRKSVDRGTHDNVPAYKLVAVALFLGISVIGVLHCLVFRACDAISASSYVAALLVLGLIALMC